jgi:hypothetical protein
MRALVRRRSEPMVGDRHLSGVTPGYVGSSRMHRETPGSAGLQNRAGHPDLRAHLRGTIAWVEGIDPRRGARLRSLYDRIAWPG